MKDEMEPSETNPPRVTNQHNKYHDDGWPEDHSGNPDKLGTKEKEKKTALSALKQTTTPSDTTYTKGSTGTVTVTTSDPSGGNKEVYPVVRYLGDPEHKKVLNSLPDAVFKGGKNTGSVDDVDRDKYSRFLSRMGGGVEDE